VFFFVFYFFIVSFNLFFLCFLFTIVLILFSIQLQSCNILNKLFFFIM